MTARSNPARQSNSQLATLLREKVRLSDTTISTSADTAPAEVVHVETVTGVDVVKVVSTSAPDSLPPPVDQPRAGGPSPACPQCPALRCAGRGTPPLLSARAAGCASDEHAAPRPSRSGVVQRGRLRSAVALAEQARAVSKYLASAAVDTVYTGPLKRQLQTVAHVSDAPIVGAGSPNTPRSRCCTTSCRGCSRGCEVRGLSQIPAAEPRSTWCRSRSPPRRRRACSTRRSRRSSRSGRATSGRPRVSSPSRRSSSACARGSIACCGKPAPEAASSR